MLSASVNTGNQHEYEFFSHSREAGQRQFRLHALGISASSPVKANMSFSTTMPILRNFR
jgi:hypothetical protein